MRVSAYNWRVKMLAVAVLALIGCEQVFGLDGRQEIDAVDAATTMVVSLEAPATVATGETLMVSAKLRGVPGTTVTCTFSANDGTFTGSDVMVEIGATGEATPSARFTAPDAMKVVTVRATVDASSASAMVGVTSAIVIGNNSTLGGVGMPAGPGKLIGGRFVPGVAGVVMRQVGVWTTAGTPIGAQARMGVYDENRVRIAETGPVPIVAGRNVFSLSSAQPLPATQIWVVVMFDRETSVFGESTLQADGYLSNATSFGPLPTMLPTGSAPMIGYSVFVVGI